MGCDELFGTVVADINSELELYMGCLPNLLKR